MSCTNGAAVSTSMNEFGTSPFLGGVPHVRVRVDQIPVSPSVALAVDVSGPDEVGEDPLGGALGDADVVCDIPEPDVRIAGDGKQDLGVIREESPVAGSFFA